MIKKILVSQPQPSNDKSPYYDIAKEFGVEFIFRPFFKVEGLTAKEFRQQKINLLDYTAVVFTSRHAIDNYFKLAKEMRITIPETMKYFCVIETIALYIQKYVQYRKRKVFFGTSGKLDNLVPTMVKHKDEKYLVPQSSVHNKAINTLLGGHKLKHKECVMYRTVSNDLTEQEKKDFDYDMLVFFSPTGVQYRYRKVLHENYLLRNDRNEAELSAMLLHNARFLASDRQRFEVSLQYHHKLSPSLSYFVGFNSEIGVFTSQKVNTFHQFSLGLTF